MALLSGSVCRSARAALLVWSYSGGDPAAARQIAACLIPLAAALFGLYIMFRGLFPRRREQGPRRHRRPRTGVSITFRRDW